MRVRILKVLSGIIDGHALSNLLPDLVYDIPEVLCLQLIEMGAATAVTATDHSAVADDAVDVSRLTGGITVVLPDE